MRIRQLRGERVVERDHGLGIDRAVLGRAEATECRRRLRQVIVGRRAAERREGIGEPRAVDVHQQPVPLRDVSAAHALSSIV